MFSNPRHLAIASSVSTVYQTFHSSKSISSIDKDEKHVNMDNATATATATNKSQSRQTQPEMKRNQRQNQKIDYPHRQNQRAALERYIPPWNEQIEFGFDMVLSPNIRVSGPPTTAKTSLVIQTVLCTQCPFAYVQCKTIPDDNKTIRWELELYSSILNQLHSFDMAHIQSLSNPEKPYETVSNVCNQALLASQSQALLASQSGFNLTDKLAHEKCFEKRWLQFKTMFDICGKNGFILDYEKENDNGDDDDGDGNNQIDKGGLVDQSRKRKRTRTRTRTQAMSLTPLTRKSGPVYIILDHVDILQSKAPYLFQAFVEMSNQVSGVNSPSIGCVIFIDSSTQTQIQTLIQYKCSKQPMITTIPFPSYNEKELIEIASTRIYAVNSRVKNTYSLSEYNMFVHFVVTTLISRTHDLLIIIAQLRLLTPVIFALEKYGIRPNKPLFSTYLRPFLIRMANQVFSLAHWTADDVGLMIHEHVVKVFEIKSSHKASRTMSRRRVVNSLMLSTISKYVLLSAFLASYNPEQEDENIFEKGSKRKVKTRMKQIKHNPIHPLLLGPQEFSFGRLCRIFRYIHLDDSYVQTLAFATRTQIPLQQQQQQQYKTQTQFPKSTSVGVYADQFGLSSVLRNLIALGCITQSTKKASSVEPHPFPDNFICNLSIIEMENIARTLDPPFEIHPHLFHPNS